MVAKKCNIKSYMHKPTQIYYF